MTAFVMVHGAFHGAWCWERLAPELRRRGHELVGPNLAVDDLRAGHAEHVEVILEAAEAYGDDVVLVAHSFFGVLAPVLASCRPFRRVVLLAAAMPVPGRSFLEAVMQEPGALSDGLLKQLVIHEDKTATVPQDVSISVWYNDCSPEDARWAASLLRRQAFKVAVEACPIDRWPDVPTDYVLCTRDRAMPAEWYRTEVPNRLGVKPIEMASDHSPFLSHPDELADLLDTLVAAR
jgi:pimeloyl-ACP methyl ester carboxylesterase